MIYILGKHTKADYYFKMRWISHWWTLASLFGILKKCLISYASGNDNPKRTNIQKIEPNITNTTWRVL